MVLGRDGQPLVSRVGGRALRDRPRLEHPIRFQPEIVMRAPRGVLLHDEEGVPPGPARLARGLRGPREVPLLPVFIQSRLCHPDQPLKRFPLFYSFPLPPTPHG